MGKEYADIHFKTVFTVGRHPVNEISRKKLVWTIHNKFSHEQYDHRRERIIRKCLVKWVDTAITHGEKATNAIVQAYGLTAKPKVVSILHGNYEGCYPPPNISKAVFKESLNIPADSTLIFCFGMLRAYKGIENVLEAVRQVNSDKVALYIAGEVQDKAYASKLVDMKANTPNVIIKFEFLTDQELANSLFAADVIACPFSSTLTSGSVILAMTQGKALILPESAKALDSITPDGILTYTSQDELTNLIMELDNEKLEEMGRINKHRAETFNWKMVGEQTVKAYGK